MPPSASLPLPFHVHKFGGTSVATSERIREVVRLVRQAPGSARRVVVVSALGGVTDVLIGAIDAASRRTSEHEEIVRGLRARHEAALEALVLPDEQAALRERMAATWQEVSELLDGIYLLRECTPRSRDAIIGTGERLSAPLVAAAFRAASEDAIDLDARRLIRTDAAFGEANVRFGETRALVHASFKEVPDVQIAVVTGFIATTETGVTTTLGRSGSDYTATILASALDAEHVVIWTDVDGVLSADPRLVPDAFPLERLSYREAAELAYFGAKVLHPRTMQPLQKGGIPLYIKNTLNPEAAGTLISSETTAAARYVKAVTTVRAVTVVMIEGAGMVGVPGISARALSALAARQISVLMISQASSEQSLCVVVRAADASASLEALRATFEFEIARGDVSRVTARPMCAVVSVVGDQMRQQPGIAGRMFSTLGHAHVNVLAIAQGAAETNISAVVDDADVRLAVSVLHQTFALEHRPVHLAVIGTGVVGRALLEILDRQAPHLRQQGGPDLRLIGVANSRQLVWEERGLPFGEARAQLAASSVPMELGGLVQRLLHSPVGRLLVIDATASEAVARQYETLLEGGIGIVTPNKRAGTLEQPFYDALKKAARKRGAPLFYETTVGAGLPVISTLRDLLYSGDRVERIEGVFSGTLAFVFDRLAAGDRFSEAVRAAREKGYTEPDPRDDLRGEDVARKALILAREMGLEAERADVQVESLVPHDLQDRSTDAFLDGLADVDAMWRERVAAAEKEGKQLRYLGRIESGCLRVGVEAVGPPSPFAHLRGTDNMIAFTTERYQERPLVVQGPGAGPDVTAAGILADVVKAVQQMP